MEMSFKGWTRGERGSSNFLAGSVSVLPGALCDIVYQQVSFFKVATITSG